MTQIIKLRFRTIILLSLISTTCFSQKKENKIIDNCIREKIHLFLKSIDRTNNLNSIHILEIVEKKVLGHNDYGVYFFTDFSSHKKKYLFIKNESKIKILNSMNSAQTLKDIADFLIDKKYPNLIAIEYLKASIEIIYNNTSAITDKIIDEQNWVECE